MRTAYGRPVAEESGLASWQAQPLGPYLSLLGFRSTVLFAGGMGGGRGGGGGETPPSYPIQGAVRSVPRRANQTVPAAPKAAATRKLVSGLTPQRKAPPKAATDTMRSRMR